MIIPERDDHILRAVRSLQIIVGGLIFGAVFFFLVAVVTFGTHGNTQLAADAPAGAQTILTRDHVPVGTRIIISPDSPNPEVRTVTAAEPVDGTQHHRVTLRAILEFDHGATEAVRRDQTSGSPIVAYVVLGLTGADLLLWALVPFAIGRSAKGKFTRTQDESVFTMSYQTRSMVAAALIEAAVFFNIIAYLISRLSISLIVAAGLILLLVGHFPSYARGSNWIQSQQELSAQPN